MRLFALGAATVVLLIASPAFAKSPAASLTLRAPALLGGESAAGPLGDLGVPNPAPHVHRTRGGMLIAGLGLMAGGLIAGGAGFAILYYCDPVGTLDCVDPSTRAIGWILAAPGIIPLAVGAILVYISVESGRGYAAAPPRGLMALSVAPLPGGGGLASGTFRF